DGGVLADEAGCVVGADGRTLGKGQSAGQHEQGASDGGEFHAGLLAGMAMDLVSRCSSACDWLRALGLRPLFRLACALQTAGLVCCDRSGSCTAPKFSDGAFHRPRAAAFRRFGAARPAARCSAWSAVTAVRAKASILCPFSP